MNEEETIDVRVQIQLPANLCFPQASKPVESTTLVDSEDLQMTLKESGTKKDHLASLLEELRENETKYKAVIDQIERTLIVPRIEIVLKGLIFYKSELIIRDDKILIHGDDPTKSNWYKVTQSIVLAHNSLIDELFRMYPDHPWRRIEVPHFSSRSHLPNLSEFPWCLNTWNTEFKETASDEWVRGFSFDIEKDSILGEEYQIASVDIGSDKLQSIHFALKAIHQSRVTLPIGWEYFYHATRHLDVGNIRNAVIDLDIAIDFVVREYIANRMALEKKHIVKILDKSSTGDLLNIAQAYARDESEFANWDTLKKLHDLRGTVLHRYQRRFSEVHLETIKRARSSIVSVLREVADCASSSKLAQH